MKLKNTPLAAVIASMAMAASSHAAITTIATDGFNTGVIAETPWSGGGTLLSVPLTGKWSLNETSNTDARLVVGNDYGYDAVGTQEGTGQAMFADGSFGGSFAATLTETVGHYFNAGDTVAIDFWTRTRASDNGPLGLTVSLVGAATLNYATYTPASSTWEQITTSYVTIETAGTYNVQFANTTSGYDKATFLDSVSYKVDAVPEPSAALLGGLGMLALLRRRRA